MPIVPEEIVEETWQRIGEAEPAVALRTMKKAAKHQPAVLAYVMACVDEADQDVLELAIYMFLVILSAFESLPACRIRKVSEKAVYTVADRTDEFVAGLEDTHERLQERIAQAQLETQPYLVGYVLECLFEEDGEVLLEEEDQGLLYLTMKTVIDLLDEACLPIRAR